MTLKWHEPSGRRQGTVPWKSGPHLFKDLRLGLKAAAITTNPHRSRWSIRLRVFKFP